MLEYLIAALMAAEKDDRGYEWEFDSKYVTPEKNWIIGEVDDVEKLWLELGGKKSASGKVQGMHKRTVTPDYEEPMSEIFIPYNAPQWLIDHEKKHAAGWKHPYVDPKIWGRYR